MSALPYLAPCMASLTPSPHPLALPRSFSIRQATCCCCNSLTTNLQTQKLIKFHFLDICGRCGGGCSATQSCRYQHLPHLARHLCSMFRCLCVQGMLLASGFNQPESYKAFSLAAREDPTSAMAEWGIAYSLGPGANRCPTIMHPAQCAEHGTKIPTTLGIQSRVTIPGTGTGNEKKAH